MRGKQKIWQPETAAYKRFQFPVHGDAIAKPEAEKPETEITPKGHSRQVDSSSHKTQSAEELPQNTLQTYYDQGLQKGKNEGYRQGVKEGRREGFEEGKLLGLQQSEQQLHSHHEAFIQSLQKELSEVKKRHSESREDLVDWLGKVIEETCRQVVRRELKTDSQQIIRVVEETLKLLPETDQYSIHLNPQDAELLTQHKPDLGVAWQLIEDRTVAQGDCRIESAGTEAEARLESRLIECLDIIRETLPASLQEVS